MENEHNPVCVLLFSGKRKSGKDYVTNKLLEICGEEKVVIIKISAPIKDYFAKSSNLNFDELLGSGEYKEKYRKDMIIWSDKMREKDAGVFCKSAIEMFNAYSKPIWIISDIRRKTDISWFKDNFMNVKTIRIEADEQVRKSRGWDFTPGIDDVASECDLDDYQLWDWKLTNNGQDNDELDSVNVIFNYIKNFL
ncbi:Phosphomevalonate kinase, putative [Pediculus humanus corporis]|uniref:Phosphomevalonate kinase n=1 Tax=Pediculus humanus subsp. corporis TaxID=121224 RepID=E0VP13_PEDHC|nr:Phosphomevalonate kinase, putative [Pediculus humanus corporis]EEB15119.1 Phosphomevalonate kinase, putative [Pediculus humanus corporis]